MTKNVCQEYNEWFICWSGWVSSEFSRAVLRGSDTAGAIEDAERVAGWFSKTFKDRFFVEIMNNGLQIQREQLLGAVDVAKRMGLPLVATSDAHYVDQEDAEVQDLSLLQIWLCRRKQRS